MSFSAFNCSCRGYSHIEGGTVCQDSAASIIDELYAAAIVCDGHGGKDYIRSERGSRIATEVFLSMTKQFMTEVAADQQLAEAIAEGGKRGNEIIHQLEKSIISEWRKKVNEDIVVNPFSDDELKTISEKMHRKIAGGECERAYGTTLIGIVVTDKFWFGIHQGDGKCILVDQDRNFSQPIPWDERCYENITTSLCDNDAITGIRHFMSGELPVAVFVATDGVDDSYANDEDMYGFYKNVLITFAEKTYEDATDEIANYLSVMSKTGSGDDISVAGCIDMDACIASKDAFVKEVEQRAAELAERKREAKIKRLLWMRQFPRKFAEHMREHPEDMQLLSSLSVTQNAPEPSPIVDGTEQIQTSENAAQTEAMPSSAVNEQMESDGVPEQKPVVQKEAEINEEQPASVMDQPVDMFPHNPVNGMSEADKNASAEICVESAEIHESSEITDDLEQQDDAGWDSPFKQEQA